MTSTNLGDAPNLSPFLFLSLIVLTWNIVFTLTGVVLNADDPVADEAVQGKQAAYGLSLAFFPVFCGISLVFKHGFLCCNQKHTLRKMIGDLAYDGTFVFMGTLYLAGDNLPIFICSSFKDTKDIGVCRGRSSFILGVSLLLHTALHLVSTFKLKSSVVPAFPVTGKIRKAYQSVLQLGTLTIFIDQTFSTVEQFIIHLDLEDIETPNCGCANNTTAGNCLSIIDGEVGGFFAGLFSIICFIVFGLMVKNWKDYCSCWTRSHMSQCCSDLWENLIIFFFHILVIVFMVLYTLADNTWLWKCVRLPDPTPGRVSLLGIILAFNLTWIGMYITVLCLPGIGIVLKNGTFFSRYEYAVILDTMDGSKWVHESGHAQTSSTDSQPPDLSAHISEISVIEHGGGALSISRSFEENTPCRQGLTYFFKWLKSCSRYCNPPNQCWESLKKKCRKVTQEIKEKMLKQQEQAKDDQEQTILLIYVGKRKNASVASLTNEGKLQCSKPEPKEREGEEHDEEEVEMQDYGKGSQNGGSDEAQSIPPSSLNGTSPKEPLEQGMIQVEIHPRQ